MKVYTKTGDDGSTSLLGGKRVSKDDLRIECYGTVDELNSHVGKLSVLSDKKQSLIQNIQNTLFDIGSLLASENPEEWNLTKVPQSKIDRLEVDMDLMNESLPALTNFVLPGGNEASAEAHICRCVCRRAERRVVTLAEDEKIDKEIIEYLNRLSDWFFVLSRYILAEAGLTDSIWSKE